MHRLNEHFADFLVIMRSLSDSCVSWRISMPITVEAVYENGVLKPTAPLPLAEHQKVEITVRTGQDAVERTYGLLGWTGDAQTVERIALEDEFGILESP
jgi:predicted DNA-binding antitoxin AbrB/MazE fold protein